MTLYKNDKMLKSLKYMKARQLLIVLGLAAVLIGVYLTISKTAENFQNMTSTRGPSMGPIRLPMLPTRPPSNLELRQKLDEMFKGSGCRDMRVRDEMQRLVGGYPGNKAQIQKAIDEYIKMAKAPSTSSTVPPGRPMCVAFLNDIKNKM